GRGVKVHLREFREDLEEQVRLVELGDLFGELEALDDVSRVGREAPDVGCEVVGQVIGVALQLPEVELRDVVKAYLRGPVQDFFRFPDSRTLEGFRLFPDGLAGIGENAVE